MNFTLFLKDFFTNYVLMSSVFAWLIAQLLKVVTGAFKVQKFSLNSLLFGSGGMPSSHTAASISLLIACCIKHGPASTYVAIAGVLSMIVIRDATGVRREMGEQAKIINRMVSESDSIEGNGYSLKERVGHTPKQVLYGALIGLCVPFVVYLIPVFRPVIEWLSVA